MISNVEVFDVNGDGTLIIKTNLNDTYENAKFAWYIYYSGCTIFKSAYQRNPYISHKIEHLGKYTIKCFVKNETEKFQEQVVFFVNETTSPQLAAASKTANIHLVPICENISGRIFRFYVNNEISEDITYAWYIYQEDDDAPCFKQMYTKFPEYIHSFKESGNYYVKVFAMCNNVKKSAKTDVFTVEVTD